MKETGVHLDLIDPSQHPSDGLVNIVTGMVVTHPSVNVQNDVKLGLLQKDMAWEVS